MLDPALILGAMVIGGMVLYAWTGGADFGGGVWNLLAFGPRARAQRELVARAVAPIWEANHVWVIFVIVVLFVCFTPVYATIGTALHIPLLLLLVGIVLRGSAFAFRSHDYGPNQRSWDFLFAAGSVISPVLLGVSLGAVASGQIRVDSEGTVTGGYFAPWFAPFPFMVGFAALLEFAHLAAVYLVFEAKDEPLRRDFRLRAVLSGIAGIVAAAGVLLVLPDGAPLLWDGFLRHPAWFGILPMAMVGSPIAIGLGYNQLARGLAACRLAAIIIGWAVAQFPYLVVPDLTIANAASSPPVLWATLNVFAVGLVLLIPGFVALYFVFKRRVTGL